MTTRRVFFSFHYAEDAWRSGQVRNMGIVEDGPTVHDNQWETVRLQSHAAIQRWIDSQIAPRSCTIVLIGSGTAHRPWVNYEIRRSWYEKKALLGIHIHRLKDRNGLQAGKGATPFNIPLNDGSSMSSYVRVYDPPYASSTSAYNFIAANIDNWVETAIADKERRR